MRSATIEITIVDIDGQIRCTIDTGRARDYHVAPILRAVADQLDAGNVEPGPSSPEHRPIVAAGMPACACGVVPPTGVDPIAWHKSHVNTALAPARRTGSELRTRDVAASAHTDTGRAITMTTDRLGAIEARVAAATPGPWKVDSAQEDPEGYTIGTSDGMSDIAGNYDWEMGGILCKTDAELIAHAPTDLADLVAALRAVLAECGHLLDLAAGADDDNDEWGAGLYDAVNDIRAAIARHLEDS